MKHILTVATSTGSKTVSVDAVSNEAALAAYKPDAGDIILSVEPEWQKKQRDAVTTEKANRDARLWRKHNG